MFKRMARSTNTPLERIGLIALLVALVTWVSTSIHWNATHHGFIYPYERTWIEKVSKPENAPAGTYWRDGPYGWALMDKACVKKHRPAPTISIGSFGDIITTPAIGYIPPRECQKKVVSHRRMSRTEWRESFTNFMDESFDSRRGDYFYLNATATVVLLLGIFLFFGWADRLLSWIRSGEKANTRPEVDRQAK